MSKPDATVAQIPTGILVSPSVKVCQAERPSPKRKVPPPRGREIPWLWIVTAGSVAWASFILVIGLSTARQEPAAAPPTAAPIEVAAVAPMPAPPIVVVEPMDEPEPATIEPPQLLLRVRPKELPGPVEIDPDFAKQDVPAEVKVIVPKAPPRFRKDVDLNVYVSCEKIGTNVLFVRDPVEAFKQAKAEKKLVFMVHLSGLLEDKEFT